MARLDAPLLLMALWGPRLSLQLDTAPFADFYLSRPIDDFLKSEITVTVHSISSLLPPY